MKMKLKEPGRRTKTTGCLPAQNILAPPFRHFWLYFPGSPCLVHSTSYATIPRNVIWRDSNPRLGFLFQEGEHRHAYSSSPNFPDMHPICDSYTEVSESTESLAGGWIPAFRVTTYWNGGPVLRWRGPFFFLPTNPLHNAISSLFLGWLSHRHRGTQLATTSNYPCHP